METVRVNINIPKKLADKVLNYAKELGLNKTSGYIVLLNQALTHIEMQNNVPELVNYTKELERFAAMIRDNRQE